MGEFFIDENDKKNTFHIVKTQDCEGIIKAIKELPDHNPYTGNTQDAHKYVGTVPNLCAVNWAKEWGVPPYSKEWLKKTVQRLKFDPDWKQLRASQTHRY